MDRRGSTSSDFTYPVNDVCRCLVQELTIYDGLNGVVEHSLCSEGEQSMLARCRKGLTLGQEIVDRGLFDLVICHLRCVVPHTGGCSLNDRKRLRTRNIGVHVALMMLLLAPGSTSVLLAQERSLVGQIVEARSQARKLGDCGNVTLVSWETRGLRKRCPSFGTVSKLDLEGNHKGRKRWRSRREEGAKLN